MGSACSIGVRRDSVAACPGIHPKTAPEQYELRIIGATGLRATSNPIAEEPSCDPFVIVMDTYGEEVARTPILFRSVDPEWDFSLRLFVVPSTPANFTLHVREVAPVSDTKLGMCCVDLKAFAEQGSEPAELQLEPDGGVPARGIIRLSAVRIQRENDRRHSGLGDDGDAGSIGSAQGGEHTGLQILVGRGYFLPTSNFVATKAYVRVQVENGTAAGRTRGVRKRSRHPVWNSMVTLPEPRSWDLDSTALRFTLCDQDLVGFSETVLGQTTISLRDLLKRELVRLMLFTKEGEAALCTQPPHMPCQIEVAVIVASIPESWPLPQPRAFAVEGYPQHVMMLTRGTRGDVQPFVALARGLATHLGWMVTIVTELRWKGFVESNADVPRGCIRFRPSGGDTERRVSTASAQWAMNSTSELMQSLMLAMSEATFFGSGPVFMSHLCEFRLSPCPVTFIVFGFTTAGVALMASERAQIPCAGFILQPSSIPSSDPTWRAIVPLKSNRAAVWELDADDTPRSPKGSPRASPRESPRGSPVPGAQRQSFSSAPPERRQSNSSLSGGQSQRSPRGSDAGNNSMFTGHKHLERIKNFAESNIFATHSLPTMRKEFGLRKASTWAMIRDRDIPLVIPMHFSTFQKPSDWGPRTVLSDFIFLRSGKATQRKPLPEHLEQFVSGRADHKLVLMTFSSMPVRRGTMLDCATRMIGESSQKLKVLYVGKRQADKVPAKLMDRAAQYTADSLLLEVEAADFGELFPRADAFVVHGGLGTTVEALRTNRPVAVTGPLLMDQRFWGDVCFRKGVGPPPCHIGDFVSHCVEFCDGALDPEDPKGWQWRARELDMGDTQDDGVLTNATAFQTLLEGGIEPAYAGTPIWTCKTRPVHLPRMPQDVAAKFDSPPPTVEQLPSPVKLPAPAGAA
eukprot:TRINITY_DN10025_c0_g1_i1.p1 TRINITY_DN10025_c0_g1~~TRINITY_DN10025_c0_g1_i1.p1  ORF type:complete len:947 (+),score=289.32 TRINITY_DN10025_c0_g1_i1:107-2842(+)